jgi:CheY-like chemotaxis protein
VTTTRTAQIDIASRETFDVILLDVRMPDVDGIEATRRLRSLGVRTPIVALTGDVLERYPAYMDAGYSAQSAKPIEIDVLVALIRSLLGRA